MGILSRCLVAFCLLAVAACTGRAWNTTLADTPGVRAAMVASVIPGVTTDKAYEIRWGRPTQIAREGAQHTWIYRNMTNPEGFYVPQFGTSADYVIVDFQYGLAVGARSSDMVGCRATFPPRPTGYHFDNPSTVHPVNCGPIGVVVTDTGPPGGGTGDGDAPYPYLK